jgi:hypothetical protein
VVKKIFDSSTSSGKYARRSFRSAGPGGSAQRAVLPAGGALLLADTVEMGLELLEITGLCAVCNRSRWCLREIRDAFHVAMVLNEETRTAILRTSMTNCDWNDESVCKQTLEIRKKPSRIAS